MTDKKPTLKLKLSGATLLKLQARIPKQLPPKATTTNPINKRAMQAKGKKGNNKVKKTPPPPKPDTVQNSPLGYTQFWGILKCLQKNNPKCFPPKEKKPKPLKVGIHKDIAKAFKISIPKAYNFVRIYFKVRRLHEVTIKGAIRRDLKGKNAGIVD